MPFEVVKDTEACSASKPWAVKTKKTGKVHGCHASKSDANKQKAALYANDAAATSFGEELERMHLLGASPVAAEAVSNADLPDPEVTYDHDGIVLAKMVGVPLMELGMNFPASTGPVTFASHHLRSVAMAANDPTIPRPRIKLGHTDPRYNDTAVYDATPNFGFCENIELRNDAYIYADLVDVPLWLCKVAPVAFPSRSIEGWFGYQGINDKEYEFVMTALSMLGVCLPGVMSLADLPQLYGSEMPSFIEIQEVATA